MTFVDEKKFELIRRIGFIYLIIGLLCLVLGCIWRDYIVILSLAMGIPLLIGGSAYIISAYFAKKVSIKLKEKLKKLGSMLINNL